MIHYYFTNFGFLFIYFLEGDVCGCVGVVVWWRRTLYMIHYYVTNVSYLFIYFREMCVGVWGWWGGGVRDYT